MSHMNLQAEETSSDPLTIRWTATIHGPEEEDWTFGGGYALSTLSTHSPDATAALLLAVGLPGAARQTQIEAAAKLDVERVEAEIAARG